MKRLNFERNGTNPDHRAWLRSPRGSHEDFIRGRWPPIKIVATSGFVSVGKDDLPEGSRFLQKPYRPEQIVATLRELTGGG
jgi:hypothetical protein